MRSILSRLSSVINSPRGAVVYCIAGIAMMGCDAPGTSKLRELCKEEGYPKVHQQVFAEGYYDDAQPCDGLLLHLDNWEYTFLECKQSNRGLIPKGLYRISKVLESSSECDAQLLHDRERRKYGFENMINSGLCFSLESIELPMAKYGLYMDKSDVIEIDNYFDSKIARRRLYILDHTNNNLVVEGNSFLLFPYPGITISSFEKTMSCRSIEEEFYEVKGLTAVDQFIHPIIPRMEKFNADNGRDVSSSAPR